VRIGSLGLDVASWQRTLNALGFRDAAGAPLIEDGDFGTRTGHATAMFKSTYGFVPADDEVTDECERKARDVLGAASTDRPSLGPRARGVDVSAMQGAVDWSSLAHAGIEFAILRCSIGNERSRDAVYAANVRGARASQLHVGGYHFAFPLPHLKPRDQARTAYEKFEVDGDALGTMVGDLPPALDIEWPPPEKKGQAPGAEWARWGCSAAQIRDWSLEWLDEAEALWGCKPLVYTYPYFWRRVLADGAAGAFGAYPLWIASYTTPGRVPAPTDTPTVLDPWGKDGWRVWQHDGDGGLKLPNGVDSDYNVFNGDTMQLAAFCGESREPRADSVAISLALSMPDAKHEQLGILSDELIRAYRAERLDVERT